MKRVQVAMGVCVGVALLTGALLAAKPAAPANARPLVLPAWAPKHPSPEFLKAAKTLKPIPQEAQKYRPTYVPAWELFGSLSDKQLKEFLTPYQVSEPLSQIPARIQEIMKKDFGGRQVGNKMVYFGQNVFFTAKTFTPRQRTFWDSFVQAWREANKGKPDEDLLVQLYKWGAKKDLSNVNVGFLLSGKHAVEFNFIVVMPRSGGTGTGEWIAQL